MSPKKVKHKISSSMPTPLNQIIGMITRFWPGFLIRLEAVFLFINPVLYSCPLPTKELNEECLYLERSGDEVYYFVYRTYPHTEHPNAAIVSL